MKKRFADFVLVQPSTGSLATTSSTFAGTEHLGLAYLASAAHRAGFSTNIIDLQETPEVTDVFVQNVIRQAPKLIGISPTSQSAKHAANLTRALRKALPTVPILWGGHLATALGNTTFQCCSEVDAVVLGEAVGLVGELLRCASKNGLPLHPKILINPSSLFRTYAFDITSRCVDWTTIFPSRQKEQGYYHARGARLITSLGCQFDCSFCTTPYFSERKRVVRKIGNLLEEVNYLVDHFGIDRVWFNDDLFCDSSPRSKKSAIKLARALHDFYPDLRFRAMLRGDVIHRDPQFIRGLTKYGLDAAFVGLESGNEHDLIVFRKRVTVEQNLRVAQVLADAGIFLQIGFIMFSPSSTLESVIENARFLRRIKQLYRFFPLSRTVQIFPGTHLWQMLTPWDSARSTPFVRYPIFRSDYVRQLSIAFEELEEVFAPVDQVLNANVMASKLTSEQLNRASGVLLDFVMSACSSAAKGAKAAEIVDMGRQTSMELMVIADTLDCTRQSLVSVKQRLTDEA